MADHATGIWWEDVTGREPEGLDVLTSVEYGRLLEGEYVSFLIRDHFKNIATPANLRINDQINAYREECRKGGCNLRSDTRLYLRVV